MSKGGSEDNNITENRERQVSNDLTTSNSNVPLATFPRLSPKTVKVIEIAVLIIALCVTIGLFCPMLKILIYVYIYI